jgi:thymidylate synthase
MGENVMHLIRARNVNRALGYGLALMDNPLHFDYETSRNGPVRVANVPVTTVTQRPMERVLFSPMRKANPFFHLFESLWMLAGRNDLPWLAQFNKRMAEYSDDGGKTQPAAYGHRWRVYFSTDQIENIVLHLRDDPSSRRAVLAMWDGGSKKGYGDLSAAIHGSKDVPCNTHCYFRVRDGELHMTVCCRSNDLWWGAHGANAVHFSVLLEYMAARIGVRVGTMTQISNNYHVYTDVVAGFPEKIEDILKNDRYSLDVAEGAVNQTPMFFPHSMDAFEQDLPKFMEYAASPCEDPAQKYAWREASPTLSHPFMAGVAIPMLHVWDLHKMGDYDAAAAGCDYIGNAGNCDWRVACAEWIERASKRSQK